MSRVSAYDYIQQICQLLETSIFLLEYRGIDVAPFLQDISKWHDGVIIDLVKCDLSNAEIGKSIEPIFEKMHELTLKQVPD